MTGDSPLRDLLEQAVMSGKHKGKKAAMCGGAVYHQTNFITILYIFLLLSYHVKKRIQVIISQMRVLCIIYPSHTAHSVGVHALLGVL